MTASPTSIDRAIVEATTGSSVDWVLIQAICDSVNGDDSVAKEAADALQKRLDLDDELIQLQSLTLLHTLGTTCSRALKIQLCTRAFTQSLVGLFSNHAAAEAVKSRLLAVMSALVEVFGSTDFELSLMAEALGQVKLLNPTIKPQAVLETPPARRKPTLEEIMAKRLAISMQEGKSQAPMRARKAASSSSSSAAAAVPAYVAPNPVAAAATPAATPTAKATAAPTKVRRVRALYDLDSHVAGELSFRKDDVIYVLERVSNDWWKGSLRGQIGIFPLNYFSPVADASPSEVQRNAETEARVFADGERVERFLAMLETVGSKKEEEEVEGMYKSVVDARPMLSEYLQQLEQVTRDLRDLSERYSEGMRKYEAYLARSGSR
ncbi:hypothetical protein BZA70DRAFT_290442 [Myxozyma melibiosi]|uniref:Class E vacuolar protein-sorting machinery protein HSE1 n=1 Tax=Myxozyma melibiosi TaxID=54550 RepID=A0ABR1F3R1_9ASCO